MTFLFCSLRIYLFLSVLKVIHPVKCMLLELLNNNAVNAAQYSLVKHAMCCQFSKALTVMVGFLHMGEVCLEGFHARQALWGVINIV